MSLTNRSRDFWRMTDGSGGARDDVVRESSRRPLLRRVLLCGTVLLAAPQAQICVAQTMSSAAANGPADVGPAQGSGAQGDTVASEPVAAEQVAARAGVPIGQGAAASSEGAPPRPVSAAAASQKIYGPVLPGGGGGVPSIIWTDPPPNTPQALVEGIQIATKIDPSVLAAWSAARAAFQDVKGAKWLRYPSLTTDLNAYGDVGGLPKNFSPTVSIELPVWTGGRISSNIDRSEALERASVAQWREAVLNIAQQASQAYYNIVLNSRLANLYKESLTEHKKLVDTMKRRVEQDVSPQADLELAQSRAAQIEQELNSIEAQRDAAMRALAELIRDPTYRLGQIPDFDPEKYTENWDDVVAEAVVFSPTRERLLYEADAAEEEIRLARGALLPRVAAQYSYNEVTGSRVGMLLRLQTSNGLSQFSAVSAAQSRYQQALQQVELSVRELKQNIATQTVAQSAAVRRSKVSGFASEAAGRVSESYVRQFIAGRRSWLDVLNSLREHLSNQSNLAQAELTAMSLRTQLNLLSGRWRPVFETKK